MVKSNDCGNSRVITTPGDESSMVRGASLAQGQVRLPSGKARLARRQEERTQRNKARAAARTGDVSARGFGPSKA
jgi:hypothetical protein